MIPTFDIAALIDETTQAYFLHKLLFDEIKAASPNGRKPDTLDRKPGESSRTFPVSSVLTFMLAVGLAHFFVVVGGLSGSRGCAKLEAVQAWISNTLFSD